MVHEERRWPALRAARKLAVLVVCAVLVGVGAPLAFGTLPRDRPPDAHVVGGNAPVNPPSSVATGYVAQNSPALVLNPRDPANLAVASRIDLPRFSCGVHVSFDGGGTWRQAPLATPPDQTIGCFAPDATFGADGTLYVAFSTFGTVPGHGVVQSGVWLVTSRDGGRSFAAPTRAAGPLAFQVRVAADPSRPARLYLTWLQAKRASSWGLESAGNPIMVSRSDDGGETWNEPVQASGPQHRRAVAPVLAVAGGDDVLLGYVDVGDDRLDYEGGHEGRGGNPYAGHWSLVTARSSDGGATWGERVLSDRLVPVGRFLQLFPPVPALAVDATRRRAYIAFHDGSLGDPDVLVWASPDGGRHWAPPTRANDTPARDGTSQVLPGLAVAPNGRLDLVYYDRRDDAHDVLSQVSFQSSFDGGKEFVRSVPLADKPFDSRIGLGADRDMPELGTRLGIVATAAGALAVWSDTRAGTAATGEQDLARALLAVRAPLQASIAWRIAGFLVLTGLVAGTVSASRRQNFRRTRIAGNRWRTSPISSA